MINLVVYSIVAFGAGMILVTLDAVSKRDDDFYDIENEGVVYY